MGPDREPMIGFDEALELVARAGGPGGREQVALAMAAGRVLAAPAIARMASPRSDVSAMDGYAVREADLAVLPARLEVAGESFAGRGWNGPLVPGTCTRIFTGARVPEGADRVVIQENVRREGSIAVIAEAPGSSRHIRRRGRDFELGDELVSAGRLLDPGAMVAAAAADVATLTVYRQPLLRILSTGDELAEPGTAAGIADAIPESVSFGAAALAERWGARVVGRGRLSDDLGPMRAAARDAVADVDLVVVTGGASVGEKDFAKTMFEPLGLATIFSKVAIRPGKPVWLGRAGEALILGLPGNPTSAMVTARLLLAPLLCGMSGREPREALRWRSAPLASPLAECGERETFHRGRWSEGAVELLANQDSGAQKGLATAELLVRQRRGSPARSPGDSIEMLEF